MTVHQLNELLSRATRGRDAVERARSAMQHDPKVAEALISAVVEIAAGDDAPADSEFKFTESQEFVKNLAAAQDALREFEEYIRDAMRVTEIPWPPDPRK